jgi:hypothetical protein
METSDAVKEKKRCEAEHNADMFLSTMKQYEEWCWDSRGWAPRYMYHVVDHYRFMVEYRKEELKLVPAKLVFEKDLRTILLWYHFQELCHDGNTIEDSEHEMMNEVYLKLEHGLKSIDPEYPVNAVIRSFNRDRSYWQHKITLDILRHLGLDLRKDHFKLPIVISDKDLENGIHEFIKEMNTRGYTKYLSSLALRNFNAAFVEKDTEEQIDMIKSILRFMYDMSLFRKKNLMGDELDEWLLIASSLFIWDDEVKIYVLSGKRPKYSY